MSNVPFLWHLRMVIFCVKLGVKIFRECWWNILCQYGYSAGDSIVVNLNAKIVIQGGTKQGGKYEKFAVSASVR